MMEIQNTWVFVFIAVSEDLYGTVSSPRQYSLYREPFVVTSSSSMSDNQVIKKSISIYRFGALI